MRPCSKSAYSAEQYRLAKDVRDIDIFFQVIAPDISFDGMVLRPLSERRPEAWSPAICSSA